jgi:oligoendopeptidase F
MAANPALAVYRFAIEDLYRQQEHVLDEKGERLLSLASRFSSAPYDAYSALSTADLKPPLVPLPGGTAVTLTYGQYRALLATNRSQADRRAAFGEPTSVRDQHQHVRPHATSAPTRLVSRAVARLPSTLDSALHGNNIPTSVVENLIETTKPAPTIAAISPPSQARARPGHVSQLRHDHPAGGRRREMPYDDVLEWLPASVAPLGGDYQKQLREALNSGWIDVYENPASAAGLCAGLRRPPYMLLNYNDTLDAVFTLAHEAGHSMHTLLSHAHQPFVYSDYDLHRRGAVHAERGAVSRVHAGPRQEQRERIVLLQHAIDGIVGTFYTQVLFADYELQAHRLVEEGQPVTADGSARSTSVCSRPITATRSTTTTSPG